MSQEPTPPATLAELHAVTSDLLRQAADPNLGASLLFPHGVNHVTITVRAGDMEVSLDLAGPDHGHEEEDDDWTLDPDEMFDEDEETV